VDAERAEEVTNVVTHGLGTEVQLARDLSSRLALFE
jgi:hypothetical protein